MQGLAVYAKNPIAWPNARGQRRSPFEHLTNNRGRPFGTPKPKADKHQQREQDVEQRAS